MHMTRRVVGVLVALGLCGFAGGLFGAHEIGAAPPPPVPTPVTCTVDCAVVK